MLIIPDDRTPEASESGGGVSQLYDSCLFAFHSLFLFSFCGWILHTQHKSGHPQRSQEEPEGTRSVEPDKDTQRTKKDKTKRLSKRQMKLQKLAEKIGAGGGGIKKNRRWSQFGTGDVLLGMLNLAEEESDRYIYII